MKVLMPDHLSFRNGEGVEAYFESVRRAPGRALLLDYDGTLAPFRVERNEAAPYPGVAALLERIAKTGKSGIAIISGRAAVEVAKLLAISEPLEIWGAHGWERRDRDGTIKMVGQLDLSAEEGLAEAEAWARAEGFGDRLETKTACLALHWRGSTDTEIAELRKSAGARWGELAGSGTLQLHEFDGGVELRVPGRNKGIVVESILGDLRPGTAVAYLGDDKTDEDAFSALRGRGLGVLVRTEFRPTGADLWIEPPGELITFLESWLRACT